MRDKEQYFIITELGINHMDGLKLVKKGTTY